MGHPANLGHLPRPINFTEPPSAILCVNCKNCDGKRKPSSQKSVVAEPIHNCAQVLVLNIVAKAGPVFFP